MVYPKISVITPSFNQGEFIQSTIESVLNQKYQNLEYIVIDGLSQDNTVSTLRSYDNQINWVSEPDKGQADAINKGIKKATGDIVAFINSDDYYFSGAFNKIADLFMKNPKIKWVTGSYKIVDQDNHPIQPLVVSYKKIIRKFSGPRVLRFANYIVQPSTFWRRSVHEEIGYFDDSLRYTFDYDFWLRLMDLCPPFVIDYPISVFRIHAKSKGGKEYMAQFAEELNVLKKYRCNWVEFQFHKLHNKMITNLYKVLK